MTDEQLQALRDEAEGNPVAWAALCEILDARKELSRLREAIEKILSDPLEELYEARGIARAVLATKEG